MSWANAAGKSKTGNKRKKKKHEDELDAPTPMSDLDSNFDPYEPLPKAGEEGINVGLWGLEGSGKTKLSLDFPDPIYIIDSENGTTNVADSIDRKKEIKHTLLLRDTKKMVEATGSILMRNYKKELTINKDVLFARFGIAASYVIDKAWHDPGSVGTVVIDDHGHLYKMAKEWRVDAYSHFESKDKADELYHKRGLMDVGEGWDNARSWAVTTSKIMEPLRLLKDMPTNLVVISKATEKSRKSGDQEILYEDPWWYYEVPGLVDMVIHMQKGDPFTATVKKVRKQGQENEYNKKYESVPKKNGHGFTFDYDKILDIMQS